jgi:transcriptional regulator with XRE-family HTH domain
MMTRHNPAKRGAEMGARARARRVELGIELKDFATQLGVTRARLQQMETAGITNIDFAMQWARELQLGPAELIFGKGRS